MNVTLLGTGTGLIRRERLSPSVLIETGDDSVIVDAGWGLPEALNRLDFPIHTLGHLCISHSHADHMAAVPALLQSQLIANIAHLPGEPRHEPLKIHGYPGIKRDLADLARIMIPELDIAADLEIYEYDGDQTRQFGALAIRAMRVRHVPTLHAVSFAFTHGSRKVAVSGDLGWDPSALPVFDQADLAVMDASASHQEFLDNPVRSHLAPVQCGQLAAMAGVKHLALTSLYDREPLPDIVGAVRQHYQGELTIPADLQRFDL